MFCKNINFQKDVGLEISRLFRCQFRVLIFSQSVFSIFAGFFILNPIKWGHKDAEKSSCPKGKFEEKFLGG